MGLGIRLLALACLVLAVTVADYEVNLSSKKLRDFFGRYDKSIPPRDINGEPLNVKVGLYPLNVEFDISAGKLPIMTMTTYVRMSWTDKRLTELVKKGDAPLTLEEGASKYAWIPDIFNRNSRNTKVVREPFDNLLMRVSEEGKVWYVYKSIEEVFCEWTKVAVANVLSCDMPFESFKYITHDVTINFLDKPVGGDNDFRSTYKLRDIIIDPDCSQNYTAGTFPCVSARFLFNTSLV